MTERPHAASAGSARATAALDRAKRLLARAGLLGLLAIALDACGTWFVASGAVLSGLAGRMAEEGQDVRSAAELSRWFGFGDRFVEPILRRSPGGDVRTLPDPLRAADVARLRAATRANARASWVFGAFALMVSALLWGLKLLDPSLRPVEADRAVAARRT